MNGNGTEWDIICVLTFSLNICNIFNEQYLMMPENRAETRITILNETIETDLWETNFVF